MNESLAGPGPRRKGPGRRGPAEAGRPQRCNRSAGGGRRGGPTAPGAEEAPRRRGHHRARLSAKTGSWGRKVRGVREGGKG